MLLIIENNENICQYFPSEAKFLNVTSMSLTETLVRLKDYQHVTHLCLPIELKFKGTYRQALGGLELFKHIRLTPELGDVQFVPILLGYTYPLERLLRNPESTILCSPSTELFHLKNIHQVISSKLFESKESLTRDTLKPYILYTDTDEAKSEHDRRNEQGPLKLERELSGISYSDIGLDLWQKKVLFLQTETKTNQPTNGSDADFKSTIKGKRILYLDDEADKWEKPLKLLFEGATVDVKQNVLEIITLLESYNKQAEDIINDFKQKDADFFQLRPEIDAAERLINLQNIGISNSGNTTKELNSQLKSNIEAAQASIKKYTDSLKILGINPQGFNISIFHKNADDLSKRMRYVSTNISMLSISQQPFQNIKTEDPDQSSVTLNYLAEIKNFYTEYISKLTKVITYDLIILDLRLMPECDTSIERPSGIDVLQFIKGINPYVPILLFTASQNLNNRDTARNLNEGGAYWIKNVSQASDLKRDILRILVDPRVHEVYWKTKLILSKNIIEKYVISNHGTSVDRVQVNNKDMVIIIKAFKYFIEFYLNKNVSFEELWNNTFNLNEARFTNDKTGRMDRPQLIKFLKLEDIEHLFNKKRNKTAHNDSEIIQTEGYEYNLFKKYIDHSLEWFLNYLPCK